MPVRILRKVVFDVDDVVWGSQRRTAERFHIPFEFLDEFRVMENSRLTMEQRTAINEYYRDPDFFNDIQFYPGFENILDLAESGAMLQFNSNGFSEEGLERKRRQICAILPGMKPEQFRFNLVDSRTTTEKKYDDNSFIVVDDNPYSIAQSPARYNIMPILPWTQTLKALGMVARKNVFYVPEGDMEAIYRLIRQFLST